MEAEKKASEPRPVVEPLGPRPKEIVALVVGEVERGGCVKLVSLVFVPQRSPGWFGGFMLI